ncbi:MAG: transcriptional regulator, partial [Campylobacter sp.]|nr:transcriptional regulator [Campylobacter sp.]
MAFDFKKEYKELYLPKNKPHIIDVSKANFITIQGSGDPNKENGDYQKAIEILYALSYSLKMSY